MPTTQIRGNTQIMDATVTSPKLSHTADEAYGTSDTVSSSNFRITKLADPVNNQDAATKAWVIANAAGGVVSSQSVKAATTANITLSGTQTIDTIALGSGDLCLVKNQTLTQNNGIYTVAGGAWTRHSSMDTWAEVPGMIVSVQQGSANADTIWLSTADAGGTLNTTPITFTQIPGPSDVQAGAGLLRTGQIIDVVATDNSLQVNANDMQVKLDSPGATNHGAITVAAGGIGVACGDNTLGVSGNALRVSQSVVLMKQDYIVRDPFLQNPDGSRTAFTLTNTPSGDNVMVFLNGLLLEPGSGNDYTIASNIVTILSPPGVLQSTDRLRATYLKGPATTGP